MSNQKCSQNLYPFLSFSVKIFSGRKSSSRSWLILTVHFGKHHNQELQTKKEGILTIFEQLGISKILNFTPPLPLLSQLFMYLVIRSPCTMCHSPAQWFVSPHTMVMLPCSKTINTGRIPRNISNTIILQKHFKTTILNKAPIKEQ